LKPTKIIKVRHPEYADDKVALYRRIMENNDEYIDKYLFKYSLREGASAYIRRRNLAYSPAYAKAYVGEISLSVTNRLPDVKRETSDTSYIRAIDGENGGVDNDGSSMNQFIGNNVLDEMLYLKYVGVFVDMPTLPQSATKADVPTTLHPYCYIYRREDILAWKEEDKILKSVLLYFEEDIEQFGLTSGRIKKYRHLQLTDGGVVETIYDQNSDELSNKLIDLPEIPFYRAEISQSLLHDIAAQQNTLLNLASSDNHYCMESNFPFYIEQYDPATDALDNLPTNSVAEDERRENEELTTLVKNVDVGPTRGRRYSKGMDAPEFIHPSPEPLKASMSKQTSIRDEMRTLLHLGLGGVTNTHAAANDRGLNYGLKAIGDELEKLERFITRMWSYYMGTKAGSIHYPEDYTLKTPEERIKEAEQLLVILKASPSKTFQREMQKKIVNLLFSTGVDYEKISEMLTEIQESNILFVDPESLIDDVEAGLVTTTEASKIRGYPEGEAKKAGLQRIERAAATLLAQKRVASEASDPEGAARGVKDLEADMNPGESSSKVEKTVSQSATISTDGDKKVRGKA